MKKSSQEEDEEKVIDPFELAATLWKQRKKLIIWSVCGAVLGLIIAFSIPKEYGTEVKLAPEVNDNKATSSGLGALASMAGLSTSSSMGADAVYPMLYPDVVSSVPFITSLFDVKVTTMPEDEDTPGKTLTVWEYMEEDTKSPWWSAVMAVPGQLIALLKEKKEVPEGHQLDNFQLTEDEYKMVLAMQDRVTAAVDAKTSVVTLNVLMQDPLVSAILADTVVARLQEYITAYRTNKSRKDLEYTQMLNKEAKDNYYAAQQRYADYLDRNQGLAFHSAQTIRERLENEATLAFNLYNQTSQQVQKAQAKVQETTPVYAILTPPTVAVKATKPKKLLILIAFTFLGFAACSAWILYVKPILENHKAKQREEEQKKLASASAGDSANGAEK